MKRLYRKLIRWIFKKLNIATADTLFRGRDAEPKRIKELRRQSDKLTEDPLVAYLEQERNKKGE